MSASEAAASCRTDYAAAVTSLNRLQSNAANIEQALRERDARCGEKIPQMTRLAARLGIQPADYNSLRVIHITGTKGKGGTAAYVESILRRHGYRTGFYSSPHLVEVRERIRINGRPLGRAAFAGHFWRTHDRLTNNPGPDPMPAYFPFLTLMAVGVFLAEQVDVAVVEVGIGGRYDSTNFVTQPWVCAISALGLDHTSLLGHSIAEIASQKAGILKPGCVGVTVDGQPAEGLAALVREASLVGCPMLLAPPLGDQQLRAALAPCQAANASLAVAVCHLWLLRRQGEAAAAAAVAVQDNNSSCSAGSEPTAPTSMQPFPLTPPFLDGIRRARWPGRNTVLPFARPAVTGAAAAAATTTTLYIDGAHTVESVAHTAAWFVSCTEQQQQQQQRRPRVLLFNRTGDRRPADLLKPLLPLGFQAALFCPNVVFGAASTKGQQLPPDMVSAAVSPELASARVAENLAAFRSLLDASAGSGGQASPSSCQCLAFDSVAEALDWIADSPFATAAAGGCDVLVTGSLHLVGCVFANLAPDIATDGGGEGAEVEKD